MTFLDVDVAALVRALGQRVVIVDSAGHEDGILNRVEDEGVTVYLDGVGYFYVWANIKAIYIVERRITPKGDK